jgi:hypothetical protein
LFCAGPVQVRRRGVTPCALARPLLLRLGMKVVRDVATALVATHLAACSANVAVGAGASCASTEGGATAPDASACANLPPPPGSSYNCYGDGIPAACVVGQTYACVAPPPSFPAPGDAGAPTVTPAACVVGKTFCYRHQPTFSSTSAEVSCPKVPDACANNPSCACLCSSSSYHCYTECSCVESSGFATITCMQI